MFSKKADNELKEVMEGVSCKTPVFGAKTSLSEFLLKKGSKIPLHAHPHEQTGYMISGLMNFIIGDEKFVTNPGDSWSIPPNVEHTVEVIEDSVVIEIFSPPREDFIPNK